MYQSTKYLAAGDRGVVVEFGNSISPKINEKVRGLMIAIEQGGLEGIVSVNTTYRSLMVEYDPLAVTYEALTGALAKMEQGLAAAQLPPPKVLEVPTLYGGECGPDLAFVSEHTGLCADEVVARHSEGEYLVFMLGFTPGFSYLGGMDPALETPRLQNPRVKIPGGSVGIAGKQTGIYSIESPGGWQLIGKTPILLYDPGREAPIIHQTGDYIKFVPVSQQEYNEVERAVSNGTYSYRYYPKNGEGN